MTTSTFVELLPNALSNVDFTKKSPEQLEVTDGGEIGKG